MNARARAMRPTGYLIREFEITNEDERGGSAMGQRTFTAYSRRQVSAIVFKLRPGTYAEVRPMFGPLA